MKTQSKAAASLLLQGQVLVPGTSFLFSSANAATAPLLVSDIGLSFWGGIDPVTSRIVDTQHPLHGKYVKDTILCIPSGRGSCTASQVLLQLILNHKAPRAIVLRQNDPLLAVGAVIAQHVFQANHNEDEIVLRIPTILNIGVDAFEQLLACEQREVGWIETSSNNATLCVTSAAFETQKGDDSTVSIKWHQQLSSGNSYTDSPWTDYEQERWDRAKNQAERLALQVMFQYARIAMMGEPSPIEVENEAPSYVPVSRAHIVRLVRAVTDLLLFSALSLTRIFICDAGCVYLHWIG